MRIPAPSFNTEIGFAMSLNTECGYDLGQLKFVDNKLIAANAGRYVTINVDVGRVFESWKKSLFSYEWLNTDGRIKTIEELTQEEGEKRRAVEEAVNNREDLEKPVLGIGIFENVEIGVGRATFLTLAAYGVNVIPVHVLKTCEPEFKDFTDRAHA